MKKVLLSLSVGLLFVGCTTKVYNNINPDILYLKDSSGTVYRAEKYVENDASFLYVLQPIPKEELEALEDESMYPPPLPLKLCPDCEKDLCPKGVCPQPAKLLHPCLTDRVL